MHVYMYPLKIWLNGIVIMEVLSGGGQYGSQFLTGGSSALGLDYGGYPSPRIYTLGINVNF